MSDTNAPKFASARKRQRLKLFLYVLGALFLVLAFLGQDPGNTFVNYMYIPLVVVFGLVIFSFVNADIKSGEEAVAADTRPPIIYLRSFEDDARATLSEMVLHHVLEDHGPFVAIGRPGDHVPQFGASRFYLDHENWQQFVTDLLGNAALVFLRAGNTQGLQWELARCAQLLHPNRLVVLLPHDKTAYASFVTSAQAAGFELTLPKLPFSFGRKSKVGDLSGLIHFDQNGKGRLVQFSRHWFKGPTGALLAGKSNERMQAALSPIGKNIGLQINKPAFNWFGIGVLLVAFAIPVAIAIIAASGQLG